MTQEQHINTQQGSDEHMLSCHNAKLSEQVSMETGILNWRWHSGDHRGDNNFIWSGLESVYLI